MFNLMISNWATRCRLLFQHPRPVVFSVSFEMLLITSYGISTVLIDDALQFSEVSIYVLLWRIKMKLE